MTSLFGRLTRFAPTELRDPGEERLTEAFAATLKAAPELAETLVERWFQRFFPGDWEALSTEELGTAEVRTQRRADGLDRVDIELLFGPRANSTLRVWLELKWDLYPGVDQLERYEKALRRLGGTYRLLLIATPHPDFPAPDERLPGNTKVETWTGVGTEIREWLRTQDRSEPALHGQQMAREFANYLEEESLSTEPFTVADALALQQHVTARERMAEIVRIAKDQVEKRFHPQTDLSDGGSWDLAGEPLGFDRCYRLDQAGLPESQRGKKGDPAPGWESSVEDCFLEWHAREDAYRGEGIGQRVFGAGVTLTGSATQLGKDREWTDGLSRRGFELNAPGRDASRLYLFRYKYPAELVGARSLQAQGDALADWVEESFQLIATSRHPRG